MSEINNSIDTRNIIDNTLGGIITTGYQDVEVSIPVRINPYINVGDITVSGNGEAEVISGPISHCSDSVSACSFTIRRTIRVEVPVEFGANPEIGEPFMECAGVSIGSNYKICPTEKIY